MVRQAHHERRSEDFEKALLACAQSSRPLGAKILYNPSDIPGDGQNGIESITAGTGKNRRSWLATPRQRVHDIQWN